MDFDHLISTEDAGTLLGVSQRRVNQLIADGYIERVKAGRVSASSAPRRICASGRQGCGAVPDADTRAALVAMGQDIERACDALAKTQRRSIEQIYRNDFRFRDVPKPATTEKQKALLYTHKTVTQAGGGNVNRFGAD